MPIVLTQVSPRVQSLALRLEAAGHDSLVLSFSELIRAETAPAPAALRAEIDAASRVVAVSPGALEFMSAGLLADWAPEGPGHAAWRWPSHCRLALVGPGSRETLIQIRERLPAGAEALLPTVESAVIAAGPPFDGEHLARLATFNAPTDAVTTPGSAADPVATPAGARLLVIQGEGATRLWISALAANGWAVRSLPLYRRRSRDPGAAALAHLLRWFDSGDATTLCWSFSQSDAVEACNGWLGAHGALAQARTGRAFANHPRVLDSLLAGGWSRAVLIDPGEAALYRALESPP